MGFFPTIKYSWRIHFLYPLSFYLISSVPCFIGIIPRIGAGTNASAHSSTGISAHKLEEAEDLKHDKVDLSLSKSIMQARTAKKMTQKELATAINEKPQVIAEYESGKAIPNPQIITKIERALGCKLPRPAKKPTPKPAASTGGSSSSTGPIRLGGTIVSQGGPPKRR